MTTRFARRRLLALALALSGAAALGCGEACSCEGPRPEPEDVRIYIVRHAEKQVPGPDASPELRKDPPLSDAGEMRALGLTEDLPLEAIKGVYVTRTERSEATASAVLALTGLEPVYYPPKDYEGIVERLSQRHGESLLLVGHSNTIPPLLAAFGVEDTISVSEDQYGDLWVLTILGSGGVKLETRRFGESIERFDPGR